MSGAIMKGARCRFDAESVPCWDPDRQCQATAVFLGEIKDRTIEGTLTSLCDDGVRQLQGRLRVTRQASGAKSRGAFRRR